MDRATETGEPSGQQPTGTISHGKARWGLAFASLGVVFGDIGTSPLYALRQSLSAIGAPDRAEVVGIVSLIIWSLVLVVTVKYVLILLRADNHGEGGTLSLLALARSVPGGNRRRGLILVLGTIAAGLFFGDAMLTPAISVVSAVEGLEVAMPGIAPAVLPITAGVLVALFVMQARGTGRISIVFAPVMLVWFAVLTIVGFSHILEVPGILRALLPFEALRFLLDHGFLGFLTLGSVFLAVTGAEALYADLGHFGRGPIRAAWLLVVFPALVVNYLGQGALAILRPEAIGTLFFTTVPGWAQLPMVLLATMATVIASQAVISGTYSLAWQAMQLDLLPRFRVLHTSSRLAGRIYMPRANWLMLAGVLTLLFLFKGSSALAGAYGIAVSGTMVVTTLMAAFVLVNVWGWGWGRVLLLLAPLLAVDTVFLSANLFRIEEGGYVPLAIAATIMLVIWTWVRGNRALAQRLRSDSVMLADLMASLPDMALARVEGTAVFLTATPELAPRALLHNLKHNHVLHRHNVIVTVRTAPRPRVGDEARALVAVLGEGFTAVELSFGFKEMPDVMHGLQVARAAGLPVDPASASYFISRRTLRLASATGVGRWRDRLFIRLSRLSDDSSGYFWIPSDRAVEIGTQILL